MRRFEYKDAKSHKFWEIHVEGDAFTVRYGRFGTNGQTQTKTFASAAQAQAQAEKMIRSKTKKGYDEVKLDAKAKAAAKAKAVGAGARNLELEQAILDDFDNPHPWQVYADWLQQEGDPWGERVSLEMERERAKGAAKAKLTKQIDALDQEHATHYYGASLAKLMRSKDFAQVAGLETTRGFITGVRARSPEYDWSGTAPNTILAAVVKSPASRFLRSIRVGLIDWDYPVSLSKGVDAIIKAGKLHALEQLFIGDFEFPDEQEISWVDVGKVAKVYPIAPNLRSLHLRGASIVLGKLEHPRLEHLLIETGGLPGAAVGSVGRAKLPQLRRLELWFGRQEYGGGGSVRQLAPLLKGEGVPRLEHLGLKNAEFQDDIAKALAKSKILTQLRSVDLSMGTMHEPGARAILAAADRFKHLELLDLGDNYIPRQLCRGLGDALGDIVNVGGQDQPEEWAGELHFYTNVGE